MKSCLILTLLLVLLGVFLGDAVKVEEEKFPEKRILCNTEACGCQRCTTRACKRRCRRKRRREKKKRQRLGCLEHQGIRYVGKSAQECAAILLKCNENEKLFFAGKCGCGCHKLAFCGGFANIPCKENFKCIDDPFDDCGPDNGADCGGLCVEKKKKTSSSSCPQYLGVRYVGESADQCSRIRFFCKEGESYFAAGDCGCGCQGLAYCGGKAGTECEEGLCCIDNPFDTCDPDYSSTDCRVCVEC